MTLIYQQFADKLLLGILRNEDNGIRNGSDLELVCKANNLPFDDSWLTKFINESNNHLGSGAGWDRTYSFELNAQGRARAELIRQDIESRTLRGRFKSISRSDWIALGAFVVSLFALFKK